MAKKWTQPDAPPPPLFTGAKERDLVKQINDETTLIYEQDVEPLLELNKSLQNNQQYSGDGIKNEWWHIASIPPIIQHKWLKEEGIDVSQSRSESD